jgi:hypothetical protein
MIKQPADQEENLPAELPQPSPEPQLTRLKWLLGQRYLIISLVILIFIILIFSGSGAKRVTQVTQPEPMQAKVEKLEPEPPSPPEKPLLPPETSAKQTEIPAKPPEHAAPAPKSPAHEAPAVAKGLEKPVKGEFFTRSLVKIMDDQLNKPLFGWRPNSIIFGILGVTDNVNNMQEGVLEVARRSIIVLNENMSRFGKGDAYNPHINEARNFLMVSSDKYWFPSASGKYREAMGNLNKYIEDLKHNRAQFYTRVENLIGIMREFRDILQTCFYDLVKDVERDGKPVSFFVADDYFYFSQGVAMGMAEILEGVKEDFEAELQKKNSLKLLEDAIHALHEATHLHPWVVTNAAKDGILANHRANLASYLGEVEHIVSTMYSVLATN